MSVRKYNIDDLDAMLDIYSNSKLDELQFEQATFKLLPLNEDPNRWENIQASDIYVFDTGSVVGFCAFDSNQINALFVHSNNRGTGVGRALLEFMLAQIKGPASLYVAASNYPAIDLYRRYGFEMTEKIQAVYNQVPVLAHKMQQQHVMLQQTDYLE